MPGKVKPAYWIGLALVSGLYSFYYLEFLYGLFYTMPAGRMRVVKFGFVAAAFVTGWLGLRRSLAAWVPRSWVILYFSVLGLLVLSGAYESLVARLPHGLRVVGDDLVELLVSPALYVVLGLLSRITEMV